MIDIYTDGSGTTDKPGGWAFVAVHPDGRTVEMSGYLGVATNNICELTAVCEALEWSAGLEVRIISDSEYVVNGFNTWVYGWKDRGWKTGSGGDVKNVELWQRGLDAMGRHGRKVPFKWVRGHDGNVHNERADLLANKARLNPVEEIITL